MTHRQRKLNRKYWVITPSCRITTYGRKASLLYPYGSIVKLDQQGVAIMAFRHPEAYKLMRYRCECGREEGIWNSRDGVTPFTVPCLNCKDPMGMVHVDWRADKFLPIYVPKKGDRFFVSMTKEKAREYAARNVDRSISQGHIDERSRNSTIRSLTEDYYQDGQAPDIVEMG